MAKLCSLTNTSTYKYNKTFNAVTLNSKSYVTYLPILGGSEFPRFDQCNKLTLV